MTTSRTRWRLGAAVLALGLTAAACGGGDTPPPTSTPTDDATSPTEAPGSEAAPDPADDAEGPLVIYSGRGEDLIGEALQLFTESTGIEVEVRYGGTAELAATLLEEGDRSPADVYWAQDAGALGALQDAGLFADLSSSVLDRVDGKFRSTEGQWVGVTGRARTIVYNTDELSEAEVPDSVFDLTDPEWEGRVGWAPTNGSFQSFVTAMRDIHGDDVTRQWLQDMLANGVIEFPSNTPIVEAAGRGEVSVGLVNHYYLYRFLAEDPDFPAANKFLSEDVGGLVNVAGIGILASSQRPAAAQAFAEWLLGQDAQEYFSGVREELEYPLAMDVEAAEDLPALESLNPPDIDLSNLDDLEGTLQLLREVGALE